MKNIKRLLCACAALPLLVATQAAAQSDNASDRAKERADARAEKVLKHWTKARIDAAQPRDMVIDHRGLAYERGKDGKLKPHGHDRPAELTATTPKIKLKDRETRAKPGSDRTPPTVTSVTPGDGATIGASQTFSATVTDTSGVRSVVFEIVFGGQTYTFDGVNSGNNVWTTTVSGFSDGAGSWSVIATDNVKRGGNRGVSGPFAFTVDAGSGGGDTGGGGGGGGGVVTNSRWSAGGDIQTAAGRLLYEMPSGGGWSSFVCSGTVVNDATTGRSVIITAAHCVYNDTAKAFARNVLFIPNQDGTTGSSTDGDCTNDPLGCWVPDFGVVETGWTTQVFPANIPVDYAYYVVGDTGTYSGNGAGGPLDAAVPSFDISFDAPNVDDGQAGEFTADWTHALGYSYSDDPFFMYSAEDMTTEGADNWWIPSSQLSGGSSGGPWIQPMDEGNGTGPLMSVNSWGYTTSDGMAGPKLNGTTASCLFEVAKTAPLSLGSSPDGQQGVIVDPADCGGTPPPPPPPPSGDVTASVDAYKIRGGRKTWDYAWSGATTSSVDIYLDGSVFTTTANDGAYTLQSSQKGSGSHSHKVCEAGSTTACSATVTTVF